MTRASTRAAVVLGLLALMPVGSAVAAESPGKTTPPVVTIALDEGEPKITGADKLAAGWVTFKVTATKTQHNLWLHTPKPGVAAGKADKAGEAANTARNGRPGPKAASTETISKQAAADASSAEDSLIALGGTYVAPGRPATMAVKLPPGEITVADIAAANQPGGGKITLLKVGAPGKAVRAAGKSVQVSVDDAARIKAPAKLARKGELRVSNLAASKWHFIGLQKLAEGKGEKDVAAFFANPGRTPSPFDPAASTAAAPLSGGREQYLSYNLPAGKYVFIDAWVDSSTGKFYAAQGAIKLVTLK
ncbi:MAG: hypothetical protein ACT4QG_16215 [Sporichthyaceae bacterium]